MKVHGLLATDDAYLIPDVNLGPVHLICGNYNSIQCPGVCSACGRTGFDPRPCHTKDVKTVWLAIVILVLGTNGLGNRLSSSESV